MTTLSEHLSETAHMSPLRRRARTFGLRSLADFIGLAVRRGCRHYDTGMALPEDPGTDALSDEELIVILLLGENPFQTRGIRCAAALVDPQRIQPSRLAAVARRERVQRVLRYIVDAALQHDPLRRGFWQSLADELGLAKEIPPGVLPHWSRFASLPGRTRRGESLPPQWHHAAIHVES